MNTAIHSSGVKRLDEVTGGGIPAGHPWLLIDDRPRIGFRSRWFKGESFNGIEVLRDPTLPEAMSAIKASVFEDKHLVIVTYSSSPKIEASCSVVLRVAGGELVVVKNTLGTKARPRVRLPS